MPLPSPARKARNSVNHSAAQSISSEVLKTVTIRMLKIIATLASPERAPARMMVMRLSA